MARPELDPLSLIETGALLGFLPLAIAQRAWLQRRHGRSRPASGARSGFAGPADGQPLRLLVAGEGTSVGTGAGRFDESLAPRLAYGLGLRLKRRVAWQALGGARWTASRLLRALRARPPVADIALVMLGGSDALALTGADAWRRDLREIASLLATAEVPLVAFTGVPPIDTMPAVPWPLNALLEQRGERLDRLLGTQLRTTPLAPERTVLHLPVPSIPAPPLQRAYFAGDGINPSARGYAAWASVLGQQLAREWKILPRAAARLQDPLPVGG